MDLKKLEVTIKNLKSKLNSKKETEGDALLARKTKKRLKRAQRLRRSMLKKAASLAAKTKKKEEAAS